MVGKSVAKKDDIQAFIKACSKIGWSLTQIFTEISVVYASTNVSHDAVRRWKKKLDSGLELIENAPKSEMPKFTSCDEIEIVKR